MVHRVCLEIWVGEAIWIPIHLKVEVRVEGLVESWPVNDHHFPNQDDSLRVLDVLVHELIHAIDDCQSGHGAPFRRIALAVGLTGKMTATVASPELEEKLKVILEKLGEYPHAKIQAVKKKQSTRMIKHVCENECGAIIYASRKQSEENPMMCANCTTESEEPIYMVEA